MVNLAEMGRHKVPTTPNTAMSSWPLAVEGRQPAHCYSTTIPSPCSSKTTVGQGEGLRASPRRERIDWVD